jgi:hypothetical protein
MVLLALLHDHQELIDYMYISFFAIIMKGQVYCNWQMPSKNLCILEMLKKMLQ